MSWRKIISTVLLIVLTTSVFLLSFGITNNALQQFPETTHVNYNQASGKAPLTIGNFEEMLQRIDERFMSFYSQQKEVYIKEESVTPVLTNEKYFEIQSEIIDGSGFTEENILNKDKVVVMSDDLALKLFFNTDVVGKSIYIDKESYKICGVYHNAKAFINEISGDGKQRIYIPYTAFEDYDKCDVNAIIYHKRAHGGPLIEQMNLSQYHFIHFSEKAKVIESFQHIMWLIVYIGFAVLALKILWKFCKKFIAEIKEDLQYNYFAKSIKTITRKYILLIIIAVGIPAVLLSILFLSDFSIYVVAKYMPYDNIFDIPYYISKIIENANQQNLLALSGDTYLNVLYSNTFSISLCLTLIFTILFSLLIKKSRTLADKIS